MDHEIRHEFDRLERAFEDALRQVRLATDDEETLAAWRQVQTVARELSAFLPAAV